MAIGRLIRLHLHQVVAASRAPQQKLNAMQGSAALQLDRWKNQSVDRFAVSATFLLSACLLFSCIYEGNDAKLNDFWISSNHEPIN